jgi:hypothetical protein
VRAREVNELVKEKDLTGRRMARLPGAGDDPVDAETRTR